MARQAKKRRPSAVSGKHSMYRAIRSAARIEPLETRRLLTASWTALTNPAPQGIHAMTLLSNGDVMAQFGEDVGWAILTPSSTGSYINGTWTQLSNMHDTRMFYSSQLLTNGNLFVAGGEYGTGASNAEVYNSLTNTWVRTPTPNVGEFGDSNSEILPNGNILVTPIYPGGSISSNGGTAIYNVSNNTWSTGPTLYRGSDADEQTWIKLADGSILTSDGSGGSNTSATSERYIPSSNSFVNDGTIPVKMWDSQGEIGAGGLLPNGKAFLIGSTGNTAIYTPSGYNASTGLYTPNGTTPGTWAAGPTIPGGLGEDDAPAAVLDDGTILLTGGPIDSYSGPTSFFIYNYSAGTITPLSATGNPNDTGGPDGTRFLDLPDGSVLLSTGSSQLYDFKTGTTALTAPNPAITSIVHNSDGSYTLTGTQLNGISEGAIYGDDAQMNSNYPIVRLTSSGGTVYFARTYNWSSTSLDTGSTPQTTNFTIPTGLPAGTYAVNVMVNGFISASSSITTPATTDTAPTITTPASASPSLVTGTSTTLSVVANGSSGLIYTWANTAAPSGDSTASFSSNATTTSNSVTTTFQQAGNYTFVVTVTDPAGLSTTSTVSVVVNQTLTSVAVSPATPSLTSGQTDQFTATAYDQFGNTMASQPSFTWNASGGGTISTGGLYTTPSTGALATVTATTGSLSDRTSVYVVSSPWISTDIGSPGVAGTAFNTGGTFNVSGSGLDVWNTVDHFHYVYQGLGGNGVIIARVASEPALTTGWEKAGLMIRSTLDQSSQQADISVTPGNGIAFQYRDVSGGTTANVNSGSQTAPYWVKLVRNGNLFTGYYSANGTTWTAEGSATIVMTGTAYVGLFITSQSDTVADPVLFDNISLLDAAPDSITLNAGSAATINVLANDTGPTGSTLSVTSITQGSKGTATFNASGNVTYTAGAANSGTDTLTYTMSDGLGDTATGTVSINILGLQAYYHFNEDTGTTSADATGDGYTATLSGTTWGAGVDGSYGLVLNGTSGYATIPALNLNSNTVTMSGWIKSGGAQNGAAGLIFNRDSIGDGNGLDYYNSTTLGYTWGTSAATYNFNSGLKPTVGTWTFVALVITPNNATLYMEPLHGSLTSATQTLSLPAEAFDSNSTTGIGEDSSSTSRYFLGSMDEVRIYNINLSSGQIASIANLAPTVATAASATPNPVTGSTSALSVQGADYGGASVLTYTWAATNIPSGATTPTFSVNGTNAASNTTATFYKAGSYVFTVTIADGGGLSTTSSVNVTVSSSSLMAIVITPTSSSLGSRGNQTFTAVEEDQFGNPLATQPTFTWSSTGSGSINASTGVYTAGYATGTATVTATAGTVTQNAAVTITNAAPVVTSAASASPTSVTGSTVGLSVSATDDGGADLTYTWAASGTPPAGVNFSSNNTNTSNATTATFARAGSYTLQVTITDAGGLSSTSSVVVTVNQTLTSISVSPVTANLNENQTQAFTAVGYDQFGNALVSQPVFNWTKTSGVGSVNAGTGVYTSPASAGTATVTATSGSVSSSATVAVTNASPTITTAAAATPTPVTGTTTALSVAAADDGGASNLIYTWAATTVPNGASSPVFGVNGISAANASTATFSKAGAYAFTVTVSDGQGGTVTSAVSVTVNQKLTAVVVSPATVGLNKSATQQFAATGNDQFGVAMASQPTFTWLRSGLGSINSSTGLYTAPNTTGSATITATSSSVSGTAAVTITNGAPTVVTPAAASPSPVTGSTAALSVLGADNGGESSLTYTWAATTVPNGASNPTFSINTTNAAKNTTATFSKAGNYTFTVTLTNAQGGTVTSSVNVTVNQTLTSAAVAPATITLNPNATENFSATGYDQFGVALTSQPVFTWSKTSGTGSINSGTGVYTAPASSGSAGILATSGSVTASASVTISNAVPTVATPAGASPTTVTGNSTQLSVLGADDGGESNLTYSWAATSVPNGAGTPLFVINGTNAAKTTTANFSMAGSYTFTVTLTDPQGATATSSVNVTVNQTLSSITIAPPGAGVGENTTQAFTATGLDQFGNALISQPTFTWGKIAGIGSINSGSGVYTSPSTAGTATITATSGTVTGTVSITISNSAPIVATPTSAGTVSPTTQSLSVLGADDGGELNLIYTWSATSIPNGATTPVFGINGTNAAKNTTATLSAAGIYTFTATISDGQGGTATSSVSVTINQTLSAVVLSNPTIAAGGTTQATANDQFGNAMTAAAAWSATGGTISTSGLFTGSSIDGTGGVFTITATLGAAVSTSVTVVPTRYSGSTGSDTYAIRISPTDSTMEQIFVNTAETSTPAYTVPASQLSTLSFTPNIDGTLTIDFANGNPLPASGITYSGGNGLFIEGSAAGGMGFTINGTQITDSAAGSSPISYSGLQSVEFDLAGGNNTLTQAAQPAAAVTFNAGIGNNTLNVSGGSFTFASDPAAASGSLTVNDNASVLFTAAPVAGGYAPRNLAALNLGASATATLAASATTTDRLVLETGSLSIATGATLDIGNNAAIIHNGNLTTVTSLIQSGYNSGTWTGTGITSSTAATDTNMLTAVGVMSNNNGAGAYRTTFDNQPAVATDVLLKDTYYGDTNLDGKVDGTDYSRIDSGTLTAATGWFNGDSNYDGQIDGSDYTLIDNAYNTQAAQLPVSITTAAPVPAAYYKFNDGLTATTATDSSGNAHTGTLHNTTVTTGVDATTGLAFNGTTSYASLPALNLDSNTITLSGWIDRNGNQTNGSGLIFNRTSTAGNGLTIGADNRLAYSWGASGSTYNFNSNLIIPNGQWTFVALSVTPTNATLYMQPQGGELASATSSVANAIQPFSTETDLGQDSLGGKFFKGSMDEVRIYKSALSESQILTIADLAPTVVTAAAAIPSTAVAAQAASSVLGASQAGAANLVYTWSVISAPQGATVSYSVNGTNSARYTTATGSMPGAYTFKVTISDPAHLSVTSSVSITFDKTPFDIAEVNYVSSPKGQGIVPLAVGDLNIDSRTPVIFNSNLTTADRWVLIADSLTIVGPYSQLDLGNNDLIIRNSSVSAAEQTLATVNSYIASGYGQGGASNWTYPGLVSSIAAAKGEGITALSAMLNRNAQGKAIYSTFDGQAVTATDVLVKYS